MRKKDVNEARGPELGRRELMELLGASIALAGMGACTQSPREKIFPFASQVPELTPGVPVHYATSMVLDGFATGLLARSHEGRPTKIEGNPEHPASLGATGVYEQASVLDLYDPARVRAVRFDGEPASWAQAFARFDQAATWRPWLVLPPQSSPVLAAEIARLRQRFPLATVCYHAPLSRREVYRAARSVYGRALETQYDFGRARVTLSLGADFLSAMPMSVRWSRDFAAARRQSSPDGDMPRLYVAETMLTPTGSMADHRLAMRPSEAPAIAALLLRELVGDGAQGALPDAIASGLSRAEASPHRAWIRAVAADLRRARGRSIVIAGDDAPFAVHVLAHALNAAAGNLGETVYLTEPALIEPEGGSSLEDLVRAIQSRTADAVLILDSNPVYTASPRLELARWLREVPDTMHLAYLENETSRACRWLLPLSHYLESWGDARSYDGTRSLIQPLIEPLYPAKSVLEVVAACAGQGSPRGHELLTAHWRESLGADFDVVWPEQLKLGFLRNSALPKVTARPDLRAASTELTQALAAPALEGIELYFEPSPSLYDGRFANNAWLLELPHPMTKQTWGNAAVMSPSTASQLGVVTGSVVQIDAHGRQVSVPAIVLPGHADRAVTLALGYGQDGPALLGRGIGVNAYPLRSGDAAPARAAALRATGGTERLAITQDHGDDRGRPLALIATLREYREHPGLTEHLRGPQPSLLPVFTEVGPERSSLQWAMTIDTSICTGCSSCVIACQAENNVPVVGKAEVERGREMHWLRIDRYFSGPPEQPRVVNQPMLCQHCEKAPCEYVCPVNATVHSPDGLNEMVYNRCIGTRFCSNNCPYKVRRFNWFEYTEDAGTLSMQRNPDVTVRERGVMEKCTYCVQRIRRAEIQARVERRDIAPGEVVTACQQACPTRAIQFGALEHADTEMVRWRQEPRAYAVLHDLGTRPRTQYLTRIVNTNPELEG